MSPKSASPTSAPTTESFAAVDLGASSGRVLVGHLADGRLHTVEASRFANRPVSVPAGDRTALRWDVLRLWRGVLAGLRVAGHEHGPVRSVGIDTWAVDHGLLDADGALLGNPVHYRDERTSGVPERVFAELPPAELYALTGVQFQPFNTIFQLGATAGTAQLAAARRMLLMPDLLGYWLAGVEVTELTNASTTGLLDATTRTWSARAVAALSAATGVDAGPLLAPLVAPGHVLGPLRPHLAAELALAGTELVAVGSHDTASAVAAVPMDPARAAYISSGTWSLVGVELAAPVLSEASRAANFTNELGVDGTVRYLRNVAGLWLLSESLRTWAAQGRPADLVALLAAAAHVSPLACVVDVDDPAFTPPGDMPARIAAAARRTGQRPPADEAATVRCILDSLALGYRRAIRQAADLSGRQIDVVHVVGGGARNRLLCQLTADATGLPVVAGPVEGTAMGNLLVQAWATGALPGGLPAIREVVAASSDLTRWEPTGSEAAWDAAERTLWH
ncbi:rhamnulokinase [Pengzhenrongella frigida]|uniref:Rhamnulokinase n=1 Tax=Pengzhenrongella frigida TaxID=1259133 RepID=A0A4Q5MZJ7_9MICO|nr:rhamnulokinase family protein [Cellulomonas sp. HLT2-17]RYV51165.1 rhamnulokinase [Cellulomonas sp. HLT2-17]